MSDAQIKKAFASMVVLGVVLGLIWGACRYGLTDLRALNLIGLTVIITVAGYAGVYALVTALRKTNEA